MEVRNCPRCGKVFVYTGRRFCLDCFREQEEQFRQVEMYLRSHPGANLQTVADGTGVAKEVILEFIRSGRLVTLKAEGLLRCEICGRPIDRGRICEACATQMKSGLGHGRVRFEPGGGQEPSATFARDHRVHILDMLKKKSGRKK